MPIQQQKNTKHFSRILAFFTLASVMLASISVAEARYFDPNDIFTDQELFNGNALSRTAIQNFLDAKNSVLARTTEVVNGIPKLVSEMIYELGQQYNISQKFLLAKLQHEQGLIEKSSVDQYALDWATGFSCFNRQCNDKYKGLYAQLDAAASVQKIYAERSKSSGYFGYEVGKQTKTSDGKLVAPANQATTNLYIYTPYQGGKTGIGGNYAFWRVWNRYFTERSYPDGTLLKQDIADTYYIIENNKKRKFDSASIYLKDYTAEEAVVATSQQLAYYQDGAPVLYPNNAVVKGSESGILYVLSDGKKLRVVGSGVLALLGYHIANAEALIAPVLLSDDALNTYPEGEPVTDETLYPQGVLMKNGQNGIFYVKHGVKYPIPDEAVWQENFGRAEPLAVSETVLNNFTTESPVMLQDGSVVKDASGKYYVIANKSKHPVTNGDIILREYGSARFNTIQTASNATLSALDTADTIDYINDTVPDPAPYVSYAERVGANEAIESGAGATPAYGAIFEAVDVPSPLLAGAQATVSVSFRNRGSSTWQAGKTFVKLIDENSATSSFAENNRIALASNVASGAIATFTVPVSAPLSGGPIKEWFILEYQDASSAYIEMPGGLVGKPIQVISGISAKIMKHTIPVALKNTWKPVMVTVTLKNTSMDEIWTSRRAAFSLVDSEGVESPFYDANDWIDKSVVGVPLNKSTIKPGETGTLTFTLNPRGVKPGTYTLRFSMQLRDHEKTVYLDGRETWERLIRIDK